MWTFSDSRHAEHRALDLPAQGAFVTASPASFNASQKRRRQIITLVVCGGLTDSYVVFYLGIRVAQWWVALGSLAIIWLSAGFRAVVLRNNLTAKRKEQLGEHLLGLFRDTVYESFLETVGILQTHREGSVTPGSSNDSQKSNTMALGRLDKPQRCVLVVAKPKPRSLHTWSGCEDVMKVSLEMTKSTCRSHQFDHAGYELKVPKQPFRRVIRLHLLIYVPGLLWRADSHVDYVMTATFDIETLYRDVIKLFHRCRNTNGTITGHPPMAGRNEAKISNVLCGQVIIPPAELQGSRTLTELLCYLRDPNPASQKAFTLEQSIL